MNVASLCTLPVGVLGWQGDKPMLTVVVKATFSISEDGEATLSETQMPLSLDEPDPNGDPEALRYASDFVPKKPRVDVMVVGSAHASPPATMVHAQIVVDVLEKQLVARSVKASQFIPLTRASLRATPAADAPAIGIGPVARALRVGPVAAALLDREGVPKEPLGKEFDYGVFNAAPRDQQINVLRPNATMVLIGLARGGSRRKVSLPGDRPRVFHVGESGPGATPNELALTADTLWIDTDAETCVVVWRGTIAVSKCKEPPTVLITMLERRGATRSWKEICAALGTASWERAAYAANLASSSAAAVLADEESTSPRDEPTSQAPSRSKDDEELTQQRAIAPVRAAVDIEDAESGNENTPSDDVTPIFDDEAPTPRPAGPSDEITSQVVGPDAVTVTGDVQTILDEDQTADRALPAPMGGMGGFGLRLGGPLGRRIAGPADEKTSAAVADEEATDVDEGSRASSSSNALKSTNDGSKRPFVETMAIDASSLRDEQALPFDRLREPPPRNRQQTLMIDATSLATAAALPFQAGTVDVAKLAAADGAPQPRRRDDWSTRTMSVDARAPDAPATPFEGPAAKADPSAPIAPADLRVVAPGAEARFFPRPSDSGAANEIVAPRQAPAAKSAAGPPALLALDLYASIRIALWERPFASLGEVLSERGLNEVEWLAHEQRYVDAIDAEAKNGRAALAMGVARAVAKARSARAMSADDYKSMKAELDAASDPAVVLAKRGITARAWKRIERTMKRKGDRRDSSEP